MISTLVGIWLGGAIVSFAYGVSEYGEMPDNSYLLEAGIVSALWPIYTTLTVRENWKYKEYRTRNGRSKETDTMQDSV